MKKYKNCLKIAEEKHKGQKRKFRYEDYINHPLRIANQFKDEKMKCIAILHDVIEDTETTREELMKQGISDDIVKAVEILSRRKNETYFDFILRISKHSEATKVKIEDITDNLTDLKEGSMKDKYRFARLFLRGVR